MDKTTTLVASKMTSSGHAVCPDCGSENTGHTAGDFSGCNSCHALFQVPAHEGDGNGHCRLDCPGIVGKHDRPLPTKEEQEQVRILQARALRTKAIDAAAMLCEVMDGMARLGFDYIEVQQWLTWSILPGNVMNTTREASEHDRARSASKIESVVCPWAVA